MRSTWREGQRESVSIFESDAGKKQWKPQPKRNPKKDEDPKKIKPERKDPDKEKGKGEGDKKR